MKNDLEKEEILKSLLSYLPNEYRKETPIFNEKESFIQLKNRKFIYFYNRSQELCFTEQCLRNGKTFLILLKPRENVKNKTVTTLKGKIRRNKKVLGVMGGLFLLAGIPGLLKVTPSYAAVEEYTSSSSDFEDLEMKKIIIEEDQTLPTLMQVEVSDPKELELAEEEKNDFEKLYYDVACPGNIQEFIYQKCLEYHVPFQVAMTIAHQESNGNFNNHGKVSQTNDFGFMQINKSNHAAIQKQFGFTSEDLKNDDYKNIESSIWLLSNICKMYDADDFENIFGTYNGWKNWHEKPMSIKYVSSCMNYINEIYVPLEWDETMTSHYTRS